MALIQVVSLRDVCEHVHTLSHTHTYTHTLTLYSVRVGLAIAFLYLHTVCASACGLLNSHTQCDSIH